MDGGIGWLSPDQVAVGLPGAAKLGHLVEDEGDGLLHATVRILLEPVAGLHEADGSRDDQCATPGLLVTGGQRPLAEQIELVLVEVALQAKKQAVVFSVEHIYKVFWSTRTM